MSRDWIIVKGAHQHNLKNVDVRIPRDKLVVITGLSGSGKSSLALDTIYAEGQRRYVESLSAYARQFLAQMEKPEVEYIEGLSPAIAIQQRNIASNPRSTVGTLTEIYDYLRLIYARIGIPHCYRCGRRIEAQTVEQMVDVILKLKRGARLQVLAPLVKGRKGTYRHIFEQVRREGFVRVRVDGQIYDVEEEIRLAKNKIHNIEVVVDRLIVGPGIRQRLADSLETTLKLSSGVALINYYNSKSSKRAGELLFSEHFACVSCGISYEELTPRQFSFNSPYGACSACGGLGRKLIPYTTKILNTDSHMKRIGSLCSECKGARLRPESLAVQMGGASIAEITSMSIRKTYQFISSLELSSREKVIARDIVREIKERLHFLINVGLDYLTLDRTANTLSGGEAQRIHLATQIGAELAGVLYILDEPSIGLHQRDNKKLLATLCRLRDVGNTVLVVEHDEETIRKADYIIDLGPGAGVDGGRIIASGTLNDILESKDSLTGKYLRGDLEISVPVQRRSISTGYFLEVKGAREHNLKNIDIRFPLGLLTCVTGVSGSGKSTLVDDTLRCGLQRILGRSREEPGKHDSINGVENVDKVIVIDQAPIGRTPRSNPATYSGVFTAIRQLYALLPESRLRGYKLSRFSFNLKGGRCEACHGEGIVKIEMHFLPPVYVHCDICKGKRYNRETLEIKYRGKNIADVLTSTVVEAQKFFKNIPVIRDKLAVLAKVGLDYVQLGQPAPTLSGGEAQRIKLAYELGKRSTGRTVYILDEPTTGLHFADVQKLIDALFELTDAGNTVIVIEHNPEVIKIADYIVDLGPEGGEQGGEVVAVGTPEEVAAVTHSYTGQVLKKVLGKKRRTVL